MVMRRAIVPDWGTRALKNGGAATITRKHIVKLTAEDTIDVATAASAVLHGIATQDIVVGLFGDVQLYGKAIGTSGAAISAGAYLTTDSTGRCVTATVAAGTAVNIIGKAVTATTGADLDVEVELMAVGSPIITGAQAVADAAAATAIAAGDRFNGMKIVLLSDYSNWIFVAASTAVDTTKNLVLTPDAGTGAWLRTDKMIDLKLAIGFATADAATLMTIPVGFNLEVDRAYWEITTSFTGGTNSAIGISSNTAPHSTKGDILGGSGGDVAAAIVSTGAKYKGGTVGADYASNGIVALLASVTVRFDRIVDAFVAGAGFVHLQVRPIA